MEELTQYIKADFAVLVAVLYCIGRGLKAIQRFPNQFIPLALTFCGIGLACLSVYLNEVIAHCSSNKGNDPPK